MTAFASLRTALEKRAAYLRTKRELQGLPRDLAIEDLGIYDPETQARQAVYG
ncbi:MAG: hypothetical protein HLUCCA08_12275 [Rhodobacteraceae bacterium HLUCCA08]|nr:MAG: hypothetical protein HLUCCA08_12275 [Rhodobacteraceae bacterium HLUCCA08]